jgi:hypothetical protein
MAVVARKRKIRLPAETAIDAEVDLNLNLADLEAHTAAR